MRWFADEFDHRANSDDSPELMSNVGFSDTLSPLTRMLVESNDWFVQISDDGRVKKAVRRRDPENVPFIDPEDMDEEEKEARKADEEDALNHADSLEPMPPKDKWDLVFWLEARTKDKEVIMVEASAPWFPHLRDKRLRGYACNLEKAIKHGIKASVLCKAVGDALRKGLITKSSAKRLWELWKIKDFQAKKQ
jgi:hypothetical protein